METVRHILAQPHEVDNISIYPIQVKDFDKFAEISGILSFSKNNLDLPEEIPLLDALMYHALKQPYIIECLVGLLSLACRCPIVFKADDQHYYFEAGTGSVNSGNYEAIRQIIMTQNLIFEKPKFPSKIVEEWAEKVLAARAKSGPKYTIEDIITTVSVCTGKPYDMIAEQSLYQLYADFRRITRIKDYETLVDFKCAGAEKITIGHFAEAINMFVNPYDGLFVRQSDLSISKVI